MIRSSIQFHADPCELYSLLSELLKEGMLSLVAVSLRPFSATRVCASSLETLISEGVVNRWYFFVREPRLLCDTEREFSRLNPSSIRLDIGKMTSRGLEQSWLVCEAVPQNNERDFQQIFARIKKLTTAGVTAINPVSGATAKIRSFRYSSGAKLLAAQGVPMLPPAGNAIIIIDN